MGHNKFIQSRKRVYFYNPNISIACNFSSYKDILRKFSTDLPYFVWKEMASWKMMEAILVVIDGSFSVRETVCTVN